MKRTNSMAERVSSLDERRRQAPAFETGTKRAKRAPSAAASQRVAVGSFIHTTVSLSQTQRQALVMEASKRQMAGEHKRHDYGRVLRDVLDFWIDHQAVVDRWIRERGGKEED